MNPLAIILTDWLQRNIFYVVVGIILAFIIFILGCLIVKFYLDKVKENKSSSETKVEETNKKKSTNSLYDQIIELVGGIENIEESTVRGSRISLVLKNISLVKDEELKTLGVNGVIIMSSKVTLVVGDEASKLNDYIKNM